MLENVCIESTTDYSRFETLVGNRDVNQASVKRLIASMSKKQLASIAIVNSKNEIIDGQHRYKACKELGLPFYFIVMPDYGIEEVHVLNSNMKNWTNEDYVRQFSDRFMHGEHAFKDYKVLVDFMDNENLQLGKALAILEQGRKSGTEALREGAFFVLTSLEDAHESLSELNDIEAELGTAVVSVAFWQAYVLSKQVDGFRPELFFKKIKRARRDIEDTKNSIPHILATLEEVYNLNNRNPIPLSFEAHKIYKGSKQ